MAMTEIPTKTVESMIELFKDRYPSDFNLYSNPSVDSVLREYTILKNSGNHSDEIDARLYAYERYIIENSIDTDDKNYPYTECPFFTPQEVENLKDYYAKSGTESYVDYFGENMTAQLADSHKTQDGKTWSQRINELQNRIKYTQDYNEIDQIKQNLIDLGWNPEIEYNIENQIMATKRYISITESKLPEMSVVDIQSIIENDSLQVNIVESAGSNIAHPISIVLVRGKSQISKLIRAATKSEFTHSAIALDGDFSRLYSFNFNNELNKGGGFSLESVKGYPPFSRLCIFTFFINDEDYKKLEERIQYMLNFIKKTHYSVANLLMFPFKHIKFEMPDTMICSQFVDSCMKLINIDITGLSSSKVSPAMLYDIAVKNAKIYKIYDGLVKDFNQDKASQFLNKLARSAKPIKTEESIENYLYPEVIKVECAASMSDNTDSLIMHSYPDFITEYTVSHNNLMQYSSANDTESIKHELARLYYMNYVLERKMYHNSFVSDKEQNMKTRAKILKEFNQYLRIVMEAEQNFDFNEYYKSSSYYPYTI